MRRFLFRQRMVTVALVFIGLSCQRYRETPDVIVWKDTGLLDRANAVGIGTVSFSAECPESSQCPMENAPDWNGTGETLRLEANETWVGHLITDKLVVPQGTWPALVQFSGQTPKVVFAAEVEERTSRPVCGFSLGEPAFYYSRGHVGSGVGGPGSVFVISINGERIVDLINIRTNAWKYADGGPQAGNDMQAAFTDPSYNGSFTMDEARKEAMESKDRAPTRPPSYTIPLALDAGLGVWQGVSDTYRCIYDAGYPDGGG